MESVRLVYAVLLFFHLLLSGTPARAGVLLEPYAAYFRGAIQSASLAQPNVTTSVEILGPEAGSRIGIIGKSGGFFAIDYSAVYGKARMSNQDVANWSQQQTFLLIGTQDVKSGGRFYFGYGIDIKSYESGHTSGVDTNYFGTAYKFGIGFGVKNHVSLNFEGLWYFINRYERPTAAAGISTLYDKFTYAAFALNLGFPFWIPRK